MTGGSLIRGAGYLAALAIFSAPVASAAAEFGPTVRTKDKPFAQIEQPPRPPAPIPPEYMCEIARDGTIVHCQIIERPKR